MKKEHLKIGDRILLTKVPVFDTGETAEVLEHIIQERKMLIIDQIDEYGNPWFSVDFGEDGVHTFAIMDNDSWEFFGEKKTFENKEKQHISEQIEALTEKYFKEYDKLAQRSEKLFDEQKALEKAYQDLDKKTGLSKLYAEFGKICEEENRL